MHTTAEITAMTPKDIDALDWQEAVDPTVSEQRIVRRQWNDKRGGYDAITREAYRRRKRDAMIWGKFNADQEAAADNIAAGRDSIVWGLGAKAQSLVPPVDNGYGNTEARAGRVMELGRRYQLWMNECPKRKIVNTYVLAIVVEGMSMREAERVYRKNHKIIREHLIGGLDLYAEMFS